MTNKYSTTESSNLKSEQDFVKDGILQYDLQNNPALVRKIRVPFFKQNGINTYTDGSYFEVNFPFVSMYVVDTGIPNLYINCRVTNDDNTNDFFKLRLNDTANFQRKVSKLFIKTDQYTATEVAASSDSDIADYWMDIILFADASFKPGRTITDIIGPSNGNTIQWPWQPYILLLPSGPFPTQGNPVASGTDVPLCFANPYRKCLNIYISLPCLLYVNNEDNTYEVTTDPRFQYLAAGHHTLYNGSIMTLKTISNNTIIYCSEEY